MNYSIRQKNDPILRQIAKEVMPPWSNPRLQKLLANMKRVLRAEPDGVALAAPQVGAAWRIFVISARALPNSNHDLVFINPQIVRRSRKLTEMVEGCLSVRSIYGKIKRHEKVTVEARDENGRCFTRHTSGLIAQITQHEIDHLNGTLFTDQAHYLFRMDSNPDEKRG